MSEYLIWSEEHGRWWRPARAGYTNQIAEAGRYHQGEAVLIVRDANYGTTFNEIAIPVPAELDQLLRRSRGEGDPVVTIDDRARELEQRVNLQLAQLHPAATADEVERMIRSIIPDGWEWVESTQVGGPRSIALTRYGLEGA